MTPPSAHAAYETPSRRHSNLAMPDSASAPWKVKDAWSRFVAAGGADLVVALLEECRAIAAAAGHAPRPEPWAAAVRQLTHPQSKVTASMLGDLERGGRTEADHILGDLLHRRGAEAEGDRSILRIAYTVIKAAEARAARLLAAKGA